MRLFLSLSLVLCSELSLQKRAEVTTTDAYFKNYSYLEKIVGLYAFYRFMPFRTGSWGILSLIGNFLKAGIFTASIALIGSLVTVFGFITIRQWLHENDKEMNYEQPKGEWDCRNVRWEGLKLDAFDELYTIGLFKKLGEKKSKYVAPMEILVHSSEKMGIMHTKKRKSRGTIATDVLLPKGYSFETGKNYFLVFFGLSAEGQLNELGRTDTFEMNNCRLYRIDRDRSMMQSLLKWRNGGEKEDERAYREFYRSKENRSYEISLPTRKRDWTGEYFEISALEGGDQSLLTRIQKITLLEGDLNSPTAKLDKLGDFAIIVRQPEKRWNWEKRERVKVEVSLKAFKDIPLYGDHYRLVIQYLPKDGESLILLNITPPFKFMRDFIPPYLAREALFTPRERILEQRIKSGESKEDVAKSMSLSAQKLEIIEKVA